MREKTLPVLFDTDILIWYFRGVKKAIELIAQTPYERRYISSVCIMELIQGCKNKQELKDILAFIRENFSHVVHFDETISERAMALLQIYALSHGLRTIDAIIAATVIEKKAVLATGNYRHFNMIEKLELIEFSPNQKKK